MMLCTAVPSEAGTMPAQSSATPMSNFAATAASAEREIAQAPAPVQAPLQLVNAAPGRGTGESVTGSPAAKLAAHTPGQLIPAGLETTLPGPVTVTVRP